MKVKKECQIVDTSTPHRRRNKIIPGGRRREGAGWERKEGREREEEERDGRRKEGGNYIPRVKNTLGKKTVEAE